MKCKLIEEASGNEVKPGMTVLNFRNEIYKVTGFLSPQHVGSTGRVLVVSCDENTKEQMFYPNVFGLKIVEAKDDPFDN
jgi:hypothetical protein